VLGVAPIRYIAGAVSQEEARCDGEERTGTQILERGLETPGRCPLAANSVTNRVRLTEAQ
jgi:chaperonin GroEL